MGDQDYGFSEIMVYPCKKIKSQFNFNAVTKAKNYHSLFLTISAIATDNILNDTVSEYALYPKAPNITIMLHNIKNMIRLWILFLRLL